MRADVVIIGAGIAGLATAHALRTAGVSPLVLERARGVGGRCASRRIEEIPVDHGVVFLHGSDPEFLGALDRVESDRRLEGWPRRIRGKGLPCQRRAFDREQHRVAFGEGLSLFPKSLARGTRVQLHTKVTALAPEPGGVRVSTEEGGAITAPSVVLALAVEQTQSLLASLPGETEELRAVRWLLGTIGSVPCLTVIAGYPSGTPPPDWDMAYPEDSPVLQLLSHDSSKRREPHGVVLVLQARACWSRAHLEEPPETWSRAMLADAARRLGAWAGEPAWIQAHRWRYARTDEAASLAAPMLLHLPGGGRLGLAGEIFSPRSGGVEAAYSSGRGMARRLLSGG